MKKILLILIACIVGIQTISAQKYYESDSDIYGLGDTPTSPYANPDPITSEVSFYIQDGWGIGYQLRKDFNKYIGWNIFGVSYMSGFDSPADYGQLNLRCLGVRAYTPAFKSFRGYVDLNMGYTLSYYDRWDMEINHHFGLDFGLGVQLSKHFAIGYNLNYSTPVERYQNNTSHWARISFLF